MANIDQFEKIANPNINLNNPISKHDRIVLAINSFTENDELIGILDSFKKKYDENPNIQGISSFIWQNLKTILSLTALILKNWDATWELYYAYSSSEFSNTELAERILKETKLLDVVQQLGLKEEDENISLLENLAKTFSIPESNPLGITDLNTLNKIANILNNKEKREELLNLAEGFLECVNVKEGEKADWLGQTSKLLKYIAATPEMYQLLSDKLPYAQKEFTKTLFTIANQEELERGKSQTAKMVLSPLGKRLLDNGIINIANNKNIKDLNFEVNVSNRVKKELVDINDNKRKVKKSTIYELDPVDYDSKILAITDGKNKKLDQKTPNNLFYCLLKSDNPEALMLGLSNVVESLDRVNEQEQVAIKKYGKVIRDSLNLIKDNKQIKGFITSSENITQIIKSAVSTSYPELAAAIVDERNNQFIFGLISTVLDNPIVVEKLLENLENQTSTKQLINELLDTQILSAIKTDSEAYTKLVKAVVNSLAPSATPDFIKERIGSMAAAIDPQDLKAFANSLLDEKKSSFAKVNEVIKLSFSIAKGDRISEIDSLDFSNKELTGYQFKSIIEGLRNRYGIMTDDVKVNWENTKVKGDINDLDLSGLKLGNIDLSEVSSMKNCDISGTEINIPARFNQDIKQPDQYKLLAIDVTKKIWQDLFGADTVNSGRIADSIKLLNFLTEIINTLPEKERKQLEESYKSYPELIIGEKNKNGIADIIYNATSYTKVGIITGGIQINEVKLQEVKDEITENLRKFGQLKTEKVEWAQEIAVETAKQLFGNDFDKNLGRVKDKDKIFNTLTETLNSLTDDQFHNLKKLYTENKSDFIGEKGKSGLSNFLYESGLIISTLASHITFNQGIQLSNDTASIIKFFNAIFFSY